MAVFVLDVKTTDRKIDLLEINELPEAILYTSFMYKDRDAVVWRYSEKKTSSKNLTKFAGNQLKDDFNASALQITAG